MSILAAITLCTTAYMPNIVCAPQNITAKYVAENDNVYLSWEKADDVRILEVYQIYRNGALVDVTPNMYYWDDKFERKQANVWQVSSVFKDYESPKSDEVKDPRLPVKPGYDDWNR